MADFAAIADRAVEIVGSADPSQFEVAFSAMSAETITQDKSSLKTSEVWSVIIDNRAEWLALTEAERQAVRDTLDFNRDGVPTEQGDSARAVLVAVLGTSTKQALAAIIPETVSAWPGLTRGQVSDALRMRAAGDV